MALNYWKDGATVNGDWRRLKKTVETNLIDARETGSSILSRNSGSAGTAQRSAAGDRPSLSRTRASELRMARKIMSNTEGRERNPGINKRILRGSCVVSVESKAARTLRTEACAGESSACQINEL